MVGEVGSIFEVDGSTDELSNDEEVLVDEKSPDDFDGATVSVDEEAVVVESNSDSVSDVDESKLVETAPDEVDNVVEVVISLEYKFEENDAKDTSDEESVTDKIPWLLEAVEEDVMAEETTDDVSVVFGSIVEEGS